MSTLHVENLKGLSSGSNANKVIIPSGQTLEVADNVRHDDLPSGSVLQVVEASFGTQVTFDNASGWLGFSGSITPKSSSSKILVQVHIDGVVKEDDSGSYGNLQLYRNRGGGSTSETFLTHFAYPIGWNSSDNASGTTAYTQFLDSPSVTTSTSYDIYFVQRNASVYQQFNRDGTSYCRSSMVLMEIAG